MKKIFLSCAALFLFMSGWRVYAVNPVTDLSAIAVSSYAVRLTWTIPAPTVPGNDAHFFTFKVATAEAGPYVNVASTQSIGIKPLIPGRMENTLIDFLPSQNYCFKTYQTEDFLTWSGPSNSTCTTTFAAPTDASVVNVAKGASGWMLKVNNSPYIVKAVAYSPARVGQDPAVASLRDWMIGDVNSNSKVDVAYDSFVDKNKNNLQDANEPTVGDFQLMQQMGVNTIRMYHHPSNASAVQAGYGSDASIKQQFNHAPNKPLLRDLYKTYGIRVAMGDFLGAYVVGSGAAYATGTDYRSTAQRDRMKASVRQMVLDFKDEPFLLLYILGNENNYGFTHTNAGTAAADYAKFIEEVTQMIHQMDPNHPVAVCSGDLGMLSSLIQYAPSVDIFGANVYRGSNFGSVWQTVDSVYKKPVLITEYGTLSPQVNNGVLNETYQESTHRTCWADIMANTYGRGYKNAIGGVAFSWLDNWWQDGAPTVHTVAGTNQEWQGLYGQGNGSKSPFLREERKIVATYKSLWTPALAAFTASPTPSPSSTPSPTPETQPTPLDLGDGLK